MEGEEALKMKNETASIVAGKEEIPLKSLKDSSLWNHLLKLRIGIIEATN